MKAIIAAAGTGGHINPALAIANKIKQEEPNSEIIFVGTDRGLENDLIPRAGYDLKRIEAYGFNRKISLDNVKKMYKTFKSIGQAKKIIQDFKPDIMIGTGGYICLPVALAASKLKVPIVLHESNAFPGVAIKMLSKKASAILVGFEDAKKRIRNTENVVVVGNPSKVKKIAFTNSQKEKILKEIGLTDIEKPIVLVFGGSQGAQKINESFINIISKKINEKYQIIWATGPNQYEIIKAKLQSLNINIDNISNVKILPYIYNMEEVMNCVDLVVSRSGAMTITEISIVGKPSIFIPFPYATENHQEYNAKVLEKVGAAKIILDADLDFNILNSTINAIISDKEKMCRMSENAHAVEIKNVEDKIYVELRRIMEMEKH
ncbi:uDP-N-acetylglucosamine--N-acetylmuramyl-(pentapeptide) pyrophosphoryl-undecaprenol N-acetylglucosamine transferase [Clostridium sp. CAG:273]|nr:uDP-N-acetylglucosamine--N-acetylmuramyl-(pentapeptide) pyrophosphoryl-undecaprenol N-acetylglucosamine transferase [Clostridium sp. CAG:273]